MENMTETLEKKQDNLEKDKSAGGLQGLLHKKYVAVDITCSEVRVISVRGNQVEKWGSAPLREGVIKDGVLIEPQDLSLVLENLFTSLDLPRERVICSITGLPFTYRIIAMPDTGKAIDQEAIARVARKEMAITEPDMFLFWKAVEQHPEKKETDYFIIAVPKVAVRPLAQALEKARIELYEMGIKPLALARLISAPNAMFISLEKKYADVVIIAGGRVKTLYSFPLVYNPGDRDRIVSEAVNGLDKALKSYDHDYPGSHLAEDIPFYASGEWANDPEILKRLGEAAGRPVVFFESPLILPTDAPAAIYAANLGLALKKLPLDKKTAAARAAQYKDINLNLLDSFVKKGMKINGGQAAALISTVLILGLAYYGYDLRRDANLRYDLLKNENDAATVRLMVLQRDNKEALGVYQAGAATIQKIQSEYDALNGAQQYINNAKVNCVGDIQMVRESLPFGASFETISMNKSSVIVNGLAEDAMEVLDITDRLDADSRAAAARVTSIQPATDSVTFSLVIDK